MALDLSSPLSPPPRRPGTRPGPTSNKATEKAREARMSEREEGLNGLGQLAAIPLVATGNLADMGAVATHWPNVSHEAAVLSESNEKVANLVDKITAVGPFAGLIAATIPLVLQILVNHGRLPAGMFGQFGVLPPEMMTQRAAIDLQRQAAELARMEAEAQRDFLRAQEELAAVQRDVAAANGSAPTPPPPPED